MRTIDEMLQPGQEIREFYNTGNVNNRIINIRAIVDENYIVFRVYEKAGWKYRVYPRCVFEFMYEKGRLS